jgi:hypothetical protein
MQAAGGAVYQSALRAGLAHLGVAWTVRPDGLGEVAGIDARILRAFSTQRRRIEAELADRGLSSPRAAQVAAHRVRPPKDPAQASAPDDALRARWRAELEQLHVDGRAVQIRDLTRALGRARRDPTTAPSLGQPWLSSPAPSESESRRDAGRCDC